jgi:hypothetical protein
MISNFLSIPQFPAHAATPYYTSFKGNRSYFRPTISENLDEAVVSSTQWLVLLCPFPFVLVFPGLEVSSDSLCEHEGATPRYVGLATETIQWIGVIDYRRILTSFVESALLDLRRQDRLIQPIHSSAA